MIPWEEFLAEVRTAKAADFPADERDRWKAKLEDRALAKARELDPGFPYSDFERDLFFAAVHLGSFATVEILVERGALSRSSSSAGP